MNTVLTTLFFLFLGGIVGVLVGKLLNRLDRKDPHLIAARWVRKNCSQEEIDAAIHLMIRDQKPTPDEERIIWGIINRAPYAVGQTIRIWLDDCV